MSVSVARCVLGPFAGNSGGSDALQVGFLPVSRSRSSLVTVAQKSEVIPAWCYASSSTRSG